MSMQARKVVPIAALPLPSRWDISSAVVVTAG